MTSSSNEKTSKFGKLNLKAVFLLILLYLSTQIAIGIPLGFLNIFRTSDAILTYLSMIAISLSTFILYKFYKSQGVTLNVKKLEKKDILTILKYTFITFLLSIAVTVVLTQFKEDVNQDVKKDLLKDVFSGFIFAAIAAPINEEIVFRGLFRGVMKGSSDKWILFLSSLVFGILHVQSFDKGFFNAIYPTIPTFFMGLYFGYIYQKTENIKISISVHALYNFIILLFSLLASTM